MAARKRQDGVVTLDDLRAEAAKDDKGPFRLQITVDDEIVVPRPDADKALDLEEIMREGTSREYMQEIFGDEYDRLMKAIGGEDHGVLAGLAKKIHRHFGLGE